MTNSGGLQHISSKTMQKSNLASRPTGCIGFFIHKVGTSSVGNAPCRNPEQDNLSDGGTVMEQTVHEMPLHTSPKCHDACGGHLHHDKLTNFFLHNRPRPYEQQPENGGNQQVNSQECDGPLIEDNNLGSNTARRTGREKNY